MMSRRLRIIALVVVVLVVGCAAEPPEITSAGTLRVEVDPSAPSTVPRTASPQRTTTRPPRTTQPQGTTRPATTTGSPTTTTAPRPATTTTTPAQRVQLLCDAFLLSQGNVYESVYLSALEDVRRALRPEAPRRVRNALNTLIREDRLETRTRNRLTGFVQQEVVGECRSRYFSEVAPYDGDVVQQFFRLVVAGRRGPAERIAPAHVIARFEPWSPWPTTELISPGVRIRTEDFFVMALSETVEARCTFFAGTIRSCFLSLVD